MTEQACIIGIGATAFCRKPGSGRSDLALQLQAALAAIEDAGLRPAAIDGILPFPNLGTAEAFAANLGCANLRFAATLNLGGAAPVAAMRLAALAVTSGAAHHVLIPGGWNAYSGKSQMRQMTVEDTQATPFAGIARDFYQPFGLTSPPQWYALMARRHMHDYGTTREQLGAVALAMRAHAQRNPAALMYGKPLTLEEYLASPVVADPYHVLDCSLEVDGAAAFIVTTRTRARDLAHRPVLVLGAAAAQAAPADDFTNRRDFHRVGLEAAAEEAFGIAGVAPSDVEFAQIYDCFTFEVIQQLEAAGFCGRGEGGAFVEGGAIQLGGRLPVNTHGGLLSEGHVLGLNHVLEAVRQLRGTAGERQIEGAEVGVVTGWGDLADGSIAILGRG